MLTERSTALKGTHGENSTIKPALAWRLFADWGAHFKTIDAAASGETPSFFAASSGAEYLSPGRNLWGTATLSKMNSLERAVATVELKMPDRVPVALSNFLVIARESGAPFGEFFQNGELMAEGQIRAWKQFGHDVLMLENGTAALAQACGCEVRYPDNSAPVVQSPAIESLEQANDLKIPEPYTTHPLSELLKATRLVSQEVRGKAFVIAEADQGPFALAALLRGMERFLADIALGEHTDLIEQLLDYCREVVKRYAIAQIEAGAQATCIGESLSGPDVISPRQYERFAFANVRRLVQDLGKKRILLAYHICGNATPIIQRMVDTGAAILEIDYKVDLAKVKAATSGKTCLLGPIDPSEVMALGTKEEVSDKCREALTLLAPQGGFILAPGCTLPPDTPAGNIHTMIEAARQYQYSS
jgi:MtaA/CmuA family methyltransferase